MAKKEGLISATLATIASLCFVSGLLVITGGESNGKVGETSNNNRQHAGLKA